MPAKFWTVWTDGVHRMNVIRIGETVPWATATLIPDGEVWDAVRNRRRAKWWSLAVWKGDELLYCDMEDTWQAGRAKARQVLDQHLKEA